MRIAPAPLTTDREYLYPDDENGAKRMRGSRVQQQQQPYKLQPGQRANGGDGNRQQQQQQDEYWRYIMNEDDLCDDEEYEYQQQQKQQQQDDDRVPRRRQKKFNADHMPPSFRQAFAHQKAMQVGLEYTLQEKGGVLQTCECCSRKVDRHQFDICCDQEELAYLGAGYPLYFSFLKFCSLIIIAVFASAGGFNLYTNYYYGQTCLGQQDMTNEDTGENVTVRFPCDANWITQLSIGNKNGIENLIVLQDLLNLVSVLLLIWLFQHFRKQVKITDQDCDVADVSAPDYTVLVKNIPKEFDALNNDYDDDLRDFFERGLGVNLELKVEAVNLAYDITEISRMKERKTKIVEQKKSAIKHLYEKRQFKPGESVEDYDQELKRIEAQVNDLCFKFLDGKGKDFMRRHFTGWAFVSLQTEKQKMEVLSLMEEEGYFCWRKPKTEIVYHDSPLMIEAAPDPTNVFWENLSYSDQESKVYINYFLLFVLLVVSFFIVYFVMLWQQNITQDGLTLFGKVLYDSANPNTITIQVISIILSLVITVLRSFMNFFVEIMTVKEHQQTRTSFNISAIKKLALSQFAISALLTLIIQLIVFQGGGSGFEKVFGNGGLVYNQNFVFLLNIIIPFAAEWFDWRSVHKRVVQNWLVRKVDRGEPVLLTQQELNDLYEYPEFDIVKRYSDALMTMYLCAFYSPIMPIGMVYALAAIFLQYWADKYNLLRRRAVKYNMSAELSVEMTEMLEFFLIIYCAGSLVFDVFALERAGGQITVPIIGVAMGVLHAILPMKEVNEKCCGVPDAPPNEEPYKDVEFNFFTDYARENPATSAQAKLEFNQRLKELHEAAVRKQRQQNKRKSVPGGGGAQQAGRRPGEPKVEREFTDYIEQKQLKRKAEEQRVKRRQQFEREQQDERDQQYVNSNNNQDDRVVTNEPLMTPPSNTRKSLLHGGDVNAAGARKDRTSIMQAGTMVGDKQAVVVAIGGGAKAPVALHTSDDENENDDEYEYEEEEEEEQNGGAHQGNKKNGAGKK